MLIYGKKFILPSESSFLDFFPLKFYFVFDFKTIFMNLASDHHFIYFKFSHFRAFSTAFTPMKKCFFRILLLVNIVPAYGPTFEQQAFINWRLFFMTLKSKSRKAKLV